MKNWKYTTLGTIVVSIVIGNIILFSCNKSDPSFVDSNYPSKIGNIITTKCATIGCHNTNSYQNAANLNLTNWQTLMEGAVNGSVVIPFAPKESSLMQFINTYDDLGLISSPTMPLNATPLTREELALIRDWISNGCSNRNGEIPFASNASSRPKAYITNQGCDVVSVVDAVSKLVMRNIKVGHDDNVLEVPHNVRVSNDGKYWYVCFVNGNYVQKFDANTDQLIAEVNIGLGLWNVVKVSPDDSKAIISDLSGNGKIVEIDTKSMTVINTFEGSNLFAFPHGMAYTSSGDTIFITAQNGNMLYRFIPSIPKVTQISIEKNVVPTGVNGNLMPHEVQLSLDGKKLFVTCQKSNEVRVWDIEHDSLLAIIPVGIEPLEMAVSPQNNLLFVTCQEDNNLEFPLFKGSVAVIDMQTFKLVHTIYKQFYQPHGIAVDDKRNALYVASRNISLTGPAPHHLSECGNRNGFYDVIDIKTWKSISSGFEISVDPYSIDVRAKD